MLNPTVEACKSVILLKNGHLSVGKTSIQTLNTCSFDSIYTMIAAIYADVEAVQNQVNEIHSDSKFSKMIISMFDGDKKLATKQNSLLKQRNEILKSIFDGTTRISEFGNGLISVNCNANVSYMIEKALPASLYSYVRKKQCNDCGEERDSKRCFVDLNFEQFEARSIRELNSCLLDSLISEPTTACACGGLREVKETKFSNFIMIDLQLKHRITKMSLNDIPSKLNILGIIFALFGCIEYIGDDDEITDIDDNTGHYVSHLFRKNQRWERYDDFKAKITRSNTNEKIKAQVLFYVQEK